MLLSGWGRYPVVSSSVFRAEKVGDVGDRIASSGSHTLIARGAGRSYGDAALNRGGDTVLMGRLNRMLAFDEDSGVVRCEAGVTMAELLDVFVPRGWFLGVTPGTKYVTVGGAIASDAHGKNQHRDGNFGDFVNSITLMLASGAVIRCSEQENRDIFRSTLGGMGLTGVILDAELRLQKVAGGFVQTRRLKSRDLAETIALFDEHESAFQYSVAWVDCLARSSRVGRGVLMFGNHADATQRSHMNISSRHLKVPIDLPAWLLNPVSLRAFNNLYYALSPRKNDAVEHFDGFFYPLDFLTDWNRLYGKRGFIQYQCVLPSTSSTQSLRALLALFGDHGHGSFLAVLKRFGRGRGGLSFPVDGYTVSLDIPMRDGLLAILDRADQMVADEGGRVYLAKDARLSARMFRQMYPDLPAWRRVKDRVDPDGLFASSLSDRLEITS